MLRLKKHQEQLAIVEKEILKAVQKGQKSCWLGYYLSDTVVGHLEQLGYKVNRVRDQRDRDDTEVKW